MHMRHTGPIPGRRVHIPPPVKYEIQVGSKIQYGHRAMANNVWEQQKVRTHKKAVPLRPGCNKAELYPAQRAIQSKLLSRRVHGSRHSLSRPAALFASAL